MLAQVVVETLHVFVVGREGLDHIMLKIPFGAVVFVADRPKFQRSKIIYGEYVC